MIALMIKGWTRKLGDPGKLFKQTYNINVSYLYVKIEEDIYSSAWEPTPEELRLLNAGGRVILSIVGGQPAVKLTVETGK